MEDFSLPSKSQQANFLTSLKSDLLLPLPHPHDDKTQRHVHEGPNLVFQVVAFHSDGKMFLKAYFEVFHFHMCNKPCSSPSNS